MAKFSVDFSTGNYGSFSGSDDVISVDDLLEALRPAALHLRDAYRKTLSTTFKRRSGQLADSIDIEDSTLKTTGSGATNYAFIHVGPTGRRKNSQRKARSRAGPVNRKYAKHNRNARSTKLANAELAYLLEYGTPRIAATHWMESTNEEVEGEIQQMIEDGYHELLNQKGL